MRHRSVHSKSIHSSWWLMLLLAAVGCGSGSSLPQKPQLVVDHDSEFGNLPYYIGTSPQDSLAIQNGGLQDLIITSATLSGDSAFTNVGPTSTTLKGNQRTFVTFYFTPTAVKAYSATFTIVSNADNTPSKVITLSASGISPPDAGP